MHCTTARDGATAKFYSICVIDIKYCMDLLFNLHSVMSETFDKMPYIIVYFILGLIQYFNT